MKRVLIIAIVAVLAGGILVGQRYYAWATNSTGASDPFDEVGIGLHGYMPGFVQDWGCARLKENFGDKTMPPHGCGSSADPAQWR